MLVAALAALVASSAPAGTRSAATLPEYAVLVSAVAGGLHASKAIYSCRGPDLLAITEALKGPDEVQRIGTQLTAEALGSSKKPWPRNRRAFVYQGRRYVPDFVKGRDFVHVETERRLGLTSEIAALRAIARRRGGDLIVVTRRVTRLAPALTSAARRAWGREAGRLRIVRCV